MIPSRCRTERGRILHGIIRHETAGNDLRSGRNPSNLQVARGAQDKNRVIATAAAAVAPISPEATATGYQKASRLNVTVSARNLLVSALSLLVSAISLAISEWIFSSSAEVMSRLKGSHMWGGQVEGVRFPRIARIALSASGHRGWHMATLLRSQRRVRRETIPLSALVFPATKPSSRATSADSPHFRFPQAGRYPKRQPSSVTTSRIARTPRMKVLACCRYHPA